jgi:serine/threonine protein phosphatase PrpC
VHFETVSVSLKGDRKKNQDRCAVLCDGGSALLLLADGMGGHPKGEKAAQVLVDVGCTAFEAAPKPIDDPPGFLDDILNDAHKQIVTFGRSHNPPIDPRSTAVVALVQNGTAYWSHVGDSRLYLFRGYRIIQRTTDHSFVEEMRGRGVLTDANPIVQRYRNLVTQCLGGTSMSFSTSHGRPIAMAPRDTLLLCSDGLWGQLSDEQLIAQMRHHGSLKRMADELSHTAELAGAPSSDNVTLVALRWLGEEENKTDESAAEPAIAEPAADANDKGVQDAIEFLRSAIDDFESDS